MALDNKLFLNTFFGFLFLIFFGFGLFGAKYYAANEVRFANSRYSTSEIIRTRALSDRLSQLELQNVALESQIAELNLKADNLGTAQRTSAKDSTEARKLARFIGLQEQVGPGLEIVVKDSAKPLLLGDNPNTGIVHNTDLVQIVNDLRAAKATAISINNQPVVNSSGISCSGPIIMLNGTRITSPFSIKAIGNAREMSSYLLKKDSFINELKEYGISVTITPKTVQIPAYSREMAGL